MSNDYACMATAKVIQETDFIIATLCFMQLPLAHSFLHLRHVSGQIASLNYFPTNGQHWPLRTVASVLFLI